MGSDCESLTSVLEESSMNTCVGIDVSKGKSMVVAVQPFEK